MSKGCVGDMVELGITESYQVKRQVLISAAEAAEMILRVDDILKSAPRYGELPIVERAPLLMELCLHTFYLWILLPCLLPRPLVDW